MSRCKNDEAFLEIFGSGTKDNFTDPFNPSPLKFIDLDWFSQCSREVF